jgi:hypothetical protein
MNLAEALQINYELAELAIQQLQNSNSLVRWHTGNLSDQLRAIQLRSNEFALCIQQMRISIERSISRININERLNSQCWARLLNAMELHRFILSRVEEPDLLATTEAIEKINDQILLFQQSIQPEITNYNKLIQALRSYRSQGFYFASIFQLPKTDDLPVVLNTARLTTF